MLSFLIIFPNPFIQAKLVTTKTWLLCYMSVSSFSSIFFCGMRWEEVWRDFCLPSPASPHTKSPNMSNIYYLIPVIKWSLIYCDFVWLFGSIGEAFLIKLWHFKNSLFPDASTHQECTTNWQWGHTKSFILKSKSHIHYQIVQLLFK